MLHKPGHEFDQITGPVTAVDLVLDNPVPSIFDRTIGAGEAENNRALRQPRKRS